MKPIANKKATQFRAWQLVVLLAAVGVLVALVVAWQKRQSAQPTRNARASQARTGENADPLPYVNYVRVRKEYRGKAGVTIHDKARAGRGYNLYAARPDTAAVLVDMQGEVVHRWESRAAQPPHASPRRADPRPRSPRSG